MKQLVKILNSVDLNSQYAQLILDYMNFLTDMFPNYAVLKIVQKIRTELGAMFDKYGKQQYGPQRFNNQLIYRVEGAALQMAPMGVHLDEMVDAFQKIHTYYQEMKLQIRVFQ